MESIEPVLPKRLCPFCKSKPELGMGYNYGMVTCSNEHCPVSEVYFLPEHWEEKQDLSIPDMSQWFELSYAQYLTIPRLVIEAMPLEWQHKMAALLTEMDESFDWRPKGGRYWVKLKDSRGRFCSAPLADYRRGHEEIEKLRWKT